jgi:hypothetical protein
MRVVPEIAKGLSRRSRHGYAPPRSCHAGLTIKRCSITVNQDRALVRRNMIDALRK